MFYLFAVRLEPLGGEGLANGSLDCSNWGEFRATTGAEVSIDTVCAGTSLTKNCMPLALYISVESHSVSDCFPPEFETYNSSQFHKKKMQSLNVFLNSHLVILL